MANNDNVCLCKGVELLTRIVDTTLGSFNVIDASYNVKRYFQNQARDLAQSTYEHIKEQKNKSTKKIDEKSLEYMDKMRDAFGDPTYTGMMKLEVVRDAIHKSDNIKQLLVCGEINGLSEAAELVREICTTFAETDDDVHPMLEQLALKFECKS